MERFTVALNWKGTGLRAMQMVAESREKVFQYLDEMGLNCYAVFTPVDVELMTYLYYRVSDRYVYDWLKGLIKHAAVDQVSYWLLVDDDSELEDDNLLTTVRTVVWADQKHKRETFRTVYPEYLQEVGMGLEDEDPRGLFDEIEEATAEELQVQDDGIGDLDEDDATLTDAQGYITIHVCDVDNEENCYTFRVPMERVD